VDATLRSPPADDDGVGVGCFATEHAGYMANVWPDGYYVIAFDPPETEEFTSLQEGTSEAIEGRGGTNRIALECVRGPPTVVTLTVNGTRVSEARHPDGVMTFGAVALLVTSGGDAATGHFDNLAISGS
jgi:hypothetical protein